MTDAEDVSDRMAELQRMRVALVILLSTETSKLLSRRQRVAGKEIEILCAERDLHRVQSDETRQGLERLYQEDGEARQALAETEGEIRQMEQLMAKIDADISALCQA